MSDELECEYFDTVGQLRPVKRDMEVQRRNVGTKCYYIMDYDYKIVINFTLTLSPQLLPLPTMPTYHGSKKTFYRRLQKLVSKRGGDSFHRR